MAELQNRCHPMARNKSGIIKQLNLKRAPIYYGLSMVMGVLVALVNYSTQAHRLNFANSKALSSFKNSSLFSNLSFRSLSQSSSYLNTTKEMTAPEMSATNSGPSPTQDRDILPNNVKPIHYDLLIKPDMEKFRFTGQVRITVQVDKPTNVIHLNAKELEMSKAVLIIEGEELNGSVAIDKKTEVMAVSFDKTLAAGTSGVLDLEFNGEVNDKMAGFYRSTYIDKPTGNRKYLGATQFEATDARKAFPCWDEPNVKATFSIALVVPKDLVALSNMDEESRFESNGLVTVKFRKSPIMSTYLIAWVIGELDYVETKNADNILVRVYTVKGDSEQGRFALKVAADTLAYFSRYFDQPYPLPKMDMVAVPDFSAGAMENWGLVTYRTSALLFDEKISALTAKQRVANVVAHELAHQWFGNLVTMDWWSDLWLNEGFATWVAWLATDHLFPEWNVWTEFIIDDSQAGLKLDSLRASHPIEVPVKNPDEIGQIFDSISYSKGASIIRMLVEFLGEDVFRSGLRAYLKRHKYGNARTCDLWESLSEASGMPVVEIMSNWTKSIGFPYLDVKVSPNAREADKLDVKITQSRFLVSGDVKPDEDNTVWNIPVRLGTNLSPEPEARGKDDLLNSKSQTFTIPANVEYFKLNVGQAGFYRVNYPTEWLEKLGQAIEDGKLSASDRIGIVADAFSMTVAGKLPLTAALNLLSHFKDERDFFVWSEIASRLSEILSVWWEQPKDVQYRLKRFIVELTRRQVDELGFEFSSNEEPLVQLLRPLILGLAAKAGSVPVVEELRSRFRKFIYGDTSVIHPNMRAIIFSTAVRNGWRAEFDAVLKLFHEFNIPDQKLAALGALATSPDTLLVKEALNLMFTDDQVRPQDYIFLISSASGNPYGRRLAWEFVAKNWEFFLEKFASGGGISLLDRIVTNSSQYLSSNTDLKMVETFFEKHRLPSIDRAITQTLEKIHINAGWLDNNQEAVSKWLNKNCPTS